MIFKLRLYDVSKREIRIRRPTPVEHDASTRLVQKIRAMFANGRTDEAVDASKRMVELIAQDMPLVEQVIQELEDQSAKNSDVSAVLKSALQRRGINSYEITKSSAVLDALVRVVEYINSDKITTAFMSAAQKIPGLVYTHITPVELTTTERSRVAFLLDEVMAG